MTLLYRVASGAKLLGISSNHDLGSPIPSLLAPQLSTEKQTDIDADSVKTNPVKELSKGSKLTSIASNLNQLPEKKGNGIVISRAKGTSGNIGEMAPKNNSILNDPYYDGRQGQSYITSC